MGNLLSAVVESFMPSAKSFDKYEAYALSVQSPKEDARFLRQVYRDLNKQEPVIMREDFCGAFALCCEWVKLDLTKRAIGLDIDPEALAYGSDNYFPLLTESAKNRLKTFKRDVLLPSVTKADLICALNFSYFIFQSRSTMLNYFKASRRSLNPRGVFIVDAFGGPVCEQPSIETKRIGGLTYFWEQESFDPINNRAQFHIHFKPKQGRKRTRVFSYDWRMWSIPELRDLMREAGFKDVIVYWEGTTRNGSGNGKYSRKSRGESCLVWLAYVIGVA
jgi:SAM-dependent methyltransferase